MVSISARRVAIAIGAPGVGLRLGSRRRSRCGNEIADRRTRHRSAARSRKPLALRFLDGARTRCGSWMGPALRTSSSKSSSDIGVRRANRRPRIATTSPAGGSMARPRASRFLRRTREERCARLDEIVDAM
jgi:hypothetical protein